MNYSKTHRSTIFRTLLSAAVLLAVPAAVRAGVCEAYFPFDGDLTDASGNAYHGLLIDENNVPLGNGSFQAGRFGQALHFDGSAAVVAPLDLHWERCPQVTIALWVKRNAQDVPYGSYVSTGYGSGPKLGAHHARVDVKGGSASGSANYTIEPGVWTPLIATWDYDAGELTLHWPEGELTEPFNEYSRPPQAELWIGADGYLGAVHHMTQGVLIDDVRVWGRVLSPEEIAAVQAGTPPQVARCPCGPGSGSSGSPPKPPTLPPGPSDEEETPPLLPDPRPRPDLDPDLIPQGDLPELPDPLGDAEAYQRQRIEEHEQNFGPRDRAQIVIGSGFELAYATVPDEFVSSKARIPAMSARLQNWLSTGKKIREMFRIKGTQGIVAVADDGTVAVEGNAQGKQGPVVAKIAEVRASGRPIDLVADQLGGYVLISGTNVHSHQAPAGAVNWARQELALGQQVTALVLLNGQAWVGVSERGVGSGGMSANHWGRELVADVQDLVDAGEVVQDISAPSSSVGERWAIATDKRIFVRGFPDCNDYESFAERIETDLPRIWSCEVLQRHCLANRATWSDTDMGSGTDPNVWQVNVLVTIGIEDYDGQEKEDFDCWLEQTLRRTELLFNDTPRLELRLRTQRKTRVDGVDLPEFKMDTDKEYKKYMDRNFDTMAKTKTEGYYQVLIVNEICIGVDASGAPDCIGGRATFPHVVDPLTRKHGIIMQYPDERDWILAHELGHYLGLVHTFETAGTGALRRCNDVYPVVGVQCNSCQGTVNAAGTTCTSTYNAMDYCSGDNDDVRLNACQREKATRQRQRYLTNDGATDYFEMKGRQGAPFCTSDSDCLNDEYCNTGVGTIGRNQCKPKLSRGAACSRSGQCASGRCRLFKCK